MRSHHYNFILFWIGYILIALSPDGALLSHVVGGALIGWGVSGLYFSARDGAR